MPDPGLQAIMAALLAPEPTPAPDAPPCPPVRHRARPRLVGGTSTTPEAVEPPPAPPAAECEADPDAAAEADARDEDARTAKLRLVLMMAAEHRSQREIAARFGVTVRTVHNWLKEARERGLVGVRRSTADAFLAETEATHATMKAKLLRRMEVADARGDDRTWLACLKQLRGLEIDRYTVREKLGFFDSRRLAPAQPADEGAEETRALHRDMGRYVAYLHTGDEAHLDPDEDDGTEHAETAPLF